MLSPSLGINPVGFEELQLKVCGDFAASLLANLNHTEVVTADMPACGEPYYISAGKPTVSQDVAETHTFLDASLFLKNELISERKFVFLTLSIGAVILVWSLKITHFLSITEKSYAFLYNFFTEKLTCET